MTAQGYFTSDKRWVPNAELVGLDADGNALDKQPSTLDVAQPLEEVSAAELLDVAAQHVYALDADEVDPELDAAGDEGKIFRFKFNARADRVSDPRAVGPGGLDGSTVREALFATLSPALLRAA
jgi:hypothetical protein